MALGEVLAEPEEFVRADPDGIDDVFTRDMDVRAIASGLTATRRAA